LRKETQREIIKFTLIAIALIAAALYILFIVFVATPDPSSFEGR